MNTLSKIAIAFLGFFVIALIIYVLILRASVKDFEKNVISLEAEITLKDTSIKSLTAEVENKEKANNGLQAQNIRLIKSQTHLRDEIEKVQILLSNAKLEIVNINEVLDEQTRKDVVDILNAPLP